MTPEEQELLVALNRQTFAIWVVGIAIVVAVLAVLVVWWIEYRRDRREEEPDGPYDGYTLRWSPDDINDPGFGVSTVKRSDFGFKVDP